MCCFKLSGVGLRFCRKFAKLDKIRQTYRANKENDIFETQGRPIRHTVRRRMTWVGDERQALWWQPAAVRLPTPGWRCHWADPRDVENWWTATDSAFPLLLLLLQLNHHQCKSAHRSTKLNWTELTRFSFSTRCFVKGAFLLSFIIHSNVDQLTLIFYQM